MPLYDFKCPECGFRIEELLKHSELDKYKFFCKKCEGRHEMHRQVSMPAKTKTLWHGNWSEGLGSNRYSLAAGRQFANKREEERYLDRKGFVPTSDLPKYWIEDTKEKQESNIKEQIRRENLYDKVLAETGSEVQAAESAWPTKECLDGTVSELYDNKIKI